MLLYLSQRRTYIGLDTFLRLVSKSMRECITKPCNTLLGCCNTNNLQNVLSLPLEVSNNFDFNFLKSFNGCHTTNAPLVPGGLGYRVHSLVTDQLRCSCAKTSSIGRHLGHRFPWASVISGYWYRQTRDILILLIIFCQALLSMKSMFCHSALAGFWKQHVKLGIGKLKVAG